MNPDEDLLTVHEIAEKLRVDDTTVRRWIKQGTMEAIALPHAGKRQAYRVRRSVYDRLISGSSSSSSEEEKVYQYA